MAASELLRYGWSSSICVRCSEAEAWNTSLPGGRFSVNIGFKYPGLQSLSSKIVLARMTVLGFSKVFIETAEGRLVQPQRRIVFACGVGVNWI